MGSEWQRVTVGELVGRGIISRPLDGNHGELHPTSTEFVEFGIPFITASDLRGNRLDLQGCKFITRARAESLRKGFAISGDVLLSHKATLGRVARVPALAWPYVVLTPQVTYYRVLDHEKLNRDYLRYFFSSPEFQQALAAHSTGSTRGYVSITRQGPLPIVLPPIDEQRRIAAILGALDDKIELNRRTNQTLEEMAQALFKSWFIDFDGHDPARHVDSKLGPMPERWEARPLDSIASFLNGAACQRYRPVADEPRLPVIKIRELRDGISDRTDEATTRIPKKWHVADGDVLFSWSGSLLVTIWTGGAGALNQHLFKVTSEEFPRWFYYLWTCHHLREFQLIAAAKATTMGHIKRRHLSDALCAVPPKHEMKAADAVIAPLIARSVATALESRTLADLRDTLLPKLISGELRVPEAEAAVEAAL